MVNAVAPASIHGLSSPPRAAVWKQMHLLLTRRQAVRGDRVLSPRPAAFPSPHLLTSAHILTRVVITVLFCELL